MITRTGVNAMDSVKNFIILAVAILGTGAASAGINHALREEPTAACEDCCKCKHEWKIQRQYARHTYAEVDALLKHWKVGQPPVGAMPQFGDDGPFGDDDAGPFGAKGP